MAYVEWKYLDQLFLLGYKKRSPYLANFSCPLCNEATTSLHPNKKRAYLIEREGKTFFFCHRCNASMSASKFIYEMDPSLHKEYKFECLKEGGRERAPEPEFAPFIPKWKVATTKVELPCISELEKDHYARRYVEGRRIPIGFWGKIYFAEDFRAWVNTLVPGKFDIYGTPDARIVFPFYNKTGVLHAAQGRSLWDTVRKYILITIDETIPSVYGLDSVAWDKTVYIVEGPIDSLFLPNCLASIGGDVVSRVKDLQKENMVIVFDNEPRSIHMRQKMEKAIELGYKVVVWPREIVAKDINQMVLEGSNSDEIKNIIDSNTYKDIMAYVALCAWSKTNG
jgi:hypothetical protein